MVYMSYMETKNYECYLKNDYKKQKSKHENFQIGRHVTSRPMISLTYKFKVFSAIF